MFKKLREKLSGKDSSDTLPADDGQAGAVAEFIAVMDSFDKMSQPFHDLAEKGRAHAEKVAETGKVDHKITSQLEDALTDIRATEVQIQETREAAGDLSEAALARFETTADKIADVEQALEDAIKAIKVAKIDFESERYDDDDDDDFDFDGD
ncbi:MAG: hypothetical protein AAGC96_01900 [Pseudomonadota bacterium]